MSSPCVRTFKNQTFMSSCHKMCNGHASTIWIHLVGLYCSFRRNKGSWWLLTNLFTLAQIYQSEGLKTQEEWEILWEELQLDILGSLEQYTGHHSLKAWGHLREMRETRDNWGVKEIQIYEVLRKQYCPQPSIGR